MYRRHSRGTPGAQSGVPSVEIEDDGATLDDTEEQREAMIGSNEQMSMWAS